MTDLDSRHHAAALDQALTDQVAAVSLQARRVDDADRADVDRWLDAVVRGFLDTERTDVQRDAFFQGGAHRRKVGVYDASAPRADVPVATFASWGTALTVPGGGEVPACAISSVTVAPTHRRRGLLRSLMVGELRTAASLGFPVATLTASEAGIYGRFGFGPAAPAASWEIAVRRAGWVGPQPSGRIDFIDREQGRALAEDLHEQMRRRLPGEVALPGGHADRFFGTRPDADKPERLRVLQYRTGDVVEGLAVYTVTENHDDYASSTLDLVLLLAATDDAYAGLWRFLLSMDLIGTIRASELAVDEPLWWMLADQRSARITLRDHHYVRVLDVAASLSARQYDTADTIVLEVDDALGFASGTFVLTTDTDGTGSVELVDDAPVGEPLVRLGVTELSAMLLGGVSAATLARAGRIHTDDPARIARVFGTATAPRLSYWY